MKEKHDTRSTEQEIELLIERKRRKNLALMKIIKHLDKQIEDVEIKTPTGSAHVAAKSDSLDSRG